MQYGNNGNRMGRGMATSQGRGPSPMGMQNAAPQGQMGLQQAQAQALRGRQFGGGAGGPVPSLLNPNPGSGGEQMIFSGGMPTQPPGTIAPQAPMPMPPPNLAQPMGTGPIPQTGVPNQLMGTIAPQAPMPMGGQNRPEMMMSQPTSPISGGATGGNVLPTPNRPTPQPWSPIGYGSNQGGNVLPNPQRPGFAQPGRGGRFGGNQGYGGR